MQAYQLKGLSLAKAECYGKPHLSANYTGKGVNAYKLDENAQCIFCGRLATNTHHHPPKGTCSTFTLDTINGAWVLRPSLIALCGSGTTGCHGLVHAHEIWFEWHWNTYEDQQAWWEGLILQEIEPHSPKLYQFGRWLIKTRAENGCKVSEMFPNV